MDCQVLGLVDESYQTSCLGINRGRHDRSDSSLTYMTTINVMILGAYTGALRGQFPFPLPRGGQKIDT